MRPSDLAWGGLRWLAVPLFARKFIEQNLGPEEIETSLDGDQARVKTSSGIRLSCPAQRSGPFRTLRAIEGIGPGTELAALHYVLRFRFPHFDPLIAPDMAGIPSFARRFLVHLQHVNTIAALSPDQREEFSERFVLQRDERVLEAGPYLGFGTVRLATGAPHGRIISAEPMRRNFETASANLKCNALSNATVCQLAIGAFDGEGSIIDGGKQANSLVQGVVQGRGVGVEVSRIETLAARAGFDPTLILLTINGAELEAVEASRDYLASLSDIRLIAPGWYADAKGPIGERLAQLLETIGFRVGLTQGRMVFAYR